MEWTSVSVQKKQNADDLYELEDNCYSSDDADFLICMLGLYKYS